MGTAGCLARHGSRAGRRLELVQLQLRAMCWMVLGVLKIKPPSLHPGMQTGIFLTSIPVS